MGRLHGGGASAPLFGRRQPHTAWLHPQGPNQSPRHKQGSSSGTKGTAEIKDSPHQSLPLGYLREPTTGSGAVRRLSVPTRADFVLCGWSEALVEGTRGRKRVSRTRRQHLACSYCRKNNSAHPHTGGERRGRGKGEELHQLWKYLKGALTRRGQDTQGLCFQHQTRRNGRQAARHHCYGDTRHWSTLSRENKRNYKPHF